MSSTITSSSFINLRDLLQAVRRSRKRAAAEEALHAPAVKRPHTIALSWVAPSDAEMTSSTSPDPALTPKTSFPASSESYPNPEPKPIIIARSKPSRALNDDVILSPKRQRQVVDLSDLFYSSSDVASIFSSLKRTQKSPFRPTDRVVKRESSYDSMLNNSSRDPSPSSDDSQMSERDVDVLDSKRHSDYWKTIGDSKPSDACPECGKWIGERSSLRRTHYIQCHYDIYFSIIDHMKTESWLGRRLGSWTETNWKCVSTVENEKKWKPTPATRVCIYCKHTESRDKLYGGRAELLRHIGKAHPAACREIMKGYREKARRGEFTTKFSWTGMVKNEELHALLISSPFALSKTKLETDEATEIITID